MTIQEIKKAIIEKGTVSDTVNNYNNIDLRVRDNIKLLAENGIVAGDSCYSDETPKPKNYAGVLGLTGFYQEEAQYTKGMSEEEAREELARSQRYIPMLVFLIFDFEKSQKVVIEIHAQEELEEKSSSVEMKLDYNAFIDAHRESIKISARGNDYITITSASMLEAYNFCIVDKNSKNYELAKTMTKSLSISFYYNNEICYIVHASLCDELEEKKQLEAEEKNKGHKKQMDYYALQVRYLELLNNMKEGSEVTIMDRKGNAEQKTFIRIEENSIIYKNSPKGRKEEKGTVFTSSDFLPASIEEFNEEYKEIKINTLKKLIEEI